MKPVLRTMSIAALGALVLVGCADAGKQAAAAPSSQASATDTPSISVQGTGKVTGTPDTLTVILGVQTQGPSAKGALDANNQKAAALIGALKAKGVAANDLQTAGLSIGPTYAANSARITGYQVTNQVQATLHDLRAAGTVIDAAAAAVTDAVRVEQVSLSIDDDSALRALARAQAVQQAQAQAGQLAKAAGVKLGRIRSITDVPTGSPDTFYRVPAAAPAAVPIEAGSQQLSVLVDIVYDIAQ
jgi:uncharacterized protein